MSTPSRGPSPKRRIDSVQKLGSSHFKEALEKPMALNLDECDEIMHCVGRNGVVLQLGFMRRFDPEFELAAERIVAGEIGHPMMIKCLTHG